MIHSLRSRRARLLAASAGALLLLLAASCGDSDTAGDDPNLPAAVLAEQLLTGYEFFNQQLKTEIKRRF